MSRGLVLDPSARGLPAATAAFLADNGDGAEAEHARGEAAQIGIIGVAGQVGSAILQCLIDEAHVDPTRLLCSLRTLSDARIEKIETAGLPRAQVTTSNEELVKRCKLIFLCVRPQDVPSLKGLPFRKDCLLVSLLAATSLAALSAVTGLAVVDTTPASEASVLEGKEDDTAERGDAEEKSGGTRTAGIVRLLTGGHHMFETGDALFAVLPGPWEAPVLAPLVALLRRFRVQLIAPLETEAQAHAFSVLVVTPAAMVACDHAGSSDTISEDEVDAFVAEATDGGAPLQCASQLLEWSRRVAAPRLFDPAKHGEDYTAYADSMGTTGGLTVEVMAAIHRGASFRAAMLRGMERCRELVSDNDARIGAPGGLE